MARTPRRLISEEEPVSPTSPGCAALAGFGSYTSINVTRSLTTVSTQLSELSRTSLDPRHALGKYQAAIALFKAIVGPGILAVPAGIKNAGLISAPCVSVIFGIMTAWCMLLLLDSTKLLRRQGYRIEGMGDVGEAVFGMHGRIAVEVAIIISQLGFCTNYCVFIAENLQSVLFEVNGGKVGAADHGVPCNLLGLLGDEHLVYFIILMVVLPLTPLTWIRQVRYFAVTNVIASCLVVSSLFYMLVGVAWKLPHDGVAKDLNWFKPTGTLTFIGTTLYAFEGIGVLLPIERSMAKPSELPCVVSMIMVVSCSLQVGFALLAYMLYGESTTSIITIALNNGHFPGGRFAIIAIQLAWVIQVIFTFPLQLFPVARILEGKLWSERQSGQKWCKNVLRTGLVVLCVAISTVGYTSVDNLISLIGALGCVPLAIVFPALFHYKLKYAAKGSSSDLLEDEEEVRTENKDWFGKRSDICLVISGTMGVVLSTVLAIYSWATSSFAFQVCIEAA